MGVNGPDRPLVSMVLSQRVREGNTKKGGRRKLGDGRGLSKGPQI